MRVVFVASALLAGAAFARLEQPFVRSETAGCASVAMYFYLKDRGEDVTYKSCRDGLPPEGEAVSIKRLEGASDGLGVSLRGGLFEVGELRELRLPFIALTPGRYAVSSSGGVKTPVGHYVYVRPVKERS